MKIAFIVPRYGTEILGGPEYHCRLVAERMAERHQVDVLTTCARDASTWQNEYPEAPDRIRGVMVRPLLLVLQYAAIELVGEFLSLLGRNSLWTVVGLGGGHHDFHHGSTPYGCSLSIPYWGSRVELMDVIARELVWSGIVGCVGSGQPERLSVWLGGLPELIDVDDLAMLQARGVLDEGEVRLLQPPDDEVGAVPSVLKLAVWPS